MTEGQVRYQQVAETQRHNLAMERYTAQETKAKVSQAESTARQAAVSERNVAVQEKLFRTQNLVNSSTVVLNILKGAESFTKAFSSLMGSLGTASNVAKSLFA